MNYNDGTYRSGAQLLSEWGCKTREAKLARACAALMEQLNQKHKDHDDLDLSKHLTDEGISCSCADAYRMGYEALNAPPDDGWRDIDKRLTAVEKIAHEPFDFTHLVRRLERLEATVLGGNDEPSPPPPAERKE